MSKNLDMNKKRVRFQLWVTKVTYSFPCDVCDYETARKGELERHLFSRHRIRVSFTHKLPESPNLLAIKFRKNVVKNYTLQSFSDSDSDSDSYPPEKSGNILVKFSKIVRKNVDSALFQMLMVGLGLVLFLSFYAFLTIRKIL